MLATNHVTNSASHPSKSANIAEYKKIGHCSNLSDSYHFEPDCMETFGIFNESGILFIKELGKRIVEITG